MTDTQDKIEEILDKLEGAEPGVIFGLAEAKAAISKLILEARIEENEKLVTKIDENESAKYPKIDETDNLTYVSHGHALACKQIKRNAKVRIATLKAKLGDK